MAGLIKIQNVSKTFFTKVQKIEVLKNIAFDIAEEDFLIIFGRSGCGKSTLLHIILGLQEPTEGNVEFMGQYLYKSPATRAGYLKNEDERGEFRKSHIGMVYQQPYWIKSLTVKENVAMPLTLFGVDEDTRLKRAAEVLDQLGLSDLTNLNPKELSSGQQQLASLARALVTDPKVIIADEPTGNLDYESGQMLIRLLADLNAKQKKTIIMVTHDLEYLPYAKTVINLFNGEMVDIKIYKDKEKLALIESLKNQKEKDEKELINI